MKKDKMTTPYKVLSPENKMKWDYIKFRYNLIPERFEIRKEYWTLKLPHLIDCYLCYRIRLIDICLNKIECEIYMNQVIDHYDKINRKELPFEGYIEIDIHDELTNFEV